MLFISNIYMYIYIYTYMYLCIHIYIVAGFQITSYNMASTLTILLKSPELDRTDFEWIPKSGAFAQPLFLFQQFDIGNDTADNFILKILFLEILHYLVSLQSLILPSFNLFFLWIYLFIQYLLSVSRCIVGNTRDYNRDQDSVCPQVIATQCDICRQQSSSF
jgi:hypothetical protein